MTDDQMLDFDAQLIKEVAKRLYENRKETAVTKAIETLLWRVIETSDSVIVLRRNSVHRCEADCSILLRGAYDTAIQALYMLLEPAKREELARLYLDFFWIEKHKAIKQFDGSLTSFAKRISANPKRGAAEHAIDQRFQQVRARFENDKGKFPDKWYGFGKDLRILARTVGYESEYELLQRHLSGVVHSSYYSLTEGMPLNSFQVGNFISRLAYRILGSLAGYLSVPLQQLERQRITTASGCFFEPPPPPKV